MLLEHIIHGRKFPHIAANPIQFINHYGIQNVSADIGHQFPEAGAVHIFSGESFIFIVDSEIQIFSLENNAGVFFAEPDLYRNRVRVIKPPVYLIGVSLSGMKIFQKTKKTPIQAPEVCDIIYLLRVGYTGLRACISLWESSG